MKELYKDMAKRIVDEVDPEDKQSMKEAADFYADQVEKEFPNKTDKEKLWEYKVRLHWHARAVLY
ncbi:MAG: hypothetical protein ACLFR2_06195 [Candidatus Kapaibacterium sp.]